MGGPENAANVAGLLTRVAVAEGGQAHTRQQTPGQESSFLDVWTHSYDGMSDRLGDVASDPTTLVTSRLDLLQAVGTGLARGGAGTTHSDAVDSMAAQMDGLGGSLSAIGDADGALATIGATFAFLISIEQMLSTPFAMIPFPAFPALRITDLDVGLPHAHNHPPNLTPPNPVPVPLPSTGPVIPIPIVSGAAKTLINGMPAARCGDMGLGVWCGGYFPMYEVFLGSSSVWIEGARASRLAVDITKHCIFTSPKPSDPPIGPMVGFTTMASTNVLIGGVPMPSLLSLALGAAFKGLFKGLGAIVNRLRAGRAAQEVGEAADTLASSAAKVESRFSRMWRRMRTPRFRMNQNARQMLQTLPNPGSRVGITHINVDDLAQMTRHTGDEFALVINRHGDLEIIRGQGAQTSIRGDDILVAHTHPHSPLGGGRHPAGGRYQAHPDDIGYNPTGNHSGDMAVENSPARAGPQHQRPKAVVYEDGSARYYDRTGPMNAPPAGDSPIDANGAIDGARH